MIIICLLIITKGALYILAEAFHSSTSNCQLTNYILGHLKEQLKSAGQCCLQKWWTEIFPNLLLSAVHIERCWNLENRKVSLSLYVYIYTIGYIFNVWHCNMNFIHISGHKVCTLFPALLCSYQINRFIWNAFVRRLCEQVCENWTTRP